MSRAAVPTARPPQIDQQRFLIIDTGVNAIISGILSALFAVLVFGGRNRIPLWGLDGLLVDLIPTVFMIALMMTLGLTLFTRMRCAKGRAPLLDGRNMLPANVVFRALTMAGLATALLVPPSLGLLVLLGPETWSYTAVLVFKIVYGTAVAILITPIILKSAMRDAFARRIG